MAMTLPTWSNAPSGILPPNMRNAVLATFWNHPDSFRQIFKFGLKAPPGFPEIRKIVAEELAKSAPKPEFPGPKPATDTLLPRIPLPAHLRDRKSDNRGQTE